jgi:lipopolysaccharide heptosyltransferase I
MPQSPPPSRILIIRPSALGDVARSVPVLASLRAAYQDARIDWLVREEFAPVVASHPALSSVVRFPRKDLGRWVKSGRWGKVRSYLRSLRDPRYDVVLDCQGLARSAWLAWATRAPVRVGYADARELGWMPLTHRVRTPKVSHTVDKALALVEALGVPALRDGSAARLHASASDRAWLSGQEFATRRYAVLAPTSAWPAKEWPIERFAELARWLAGRGVVGVVVGARGERERLGPLLELTKSNPSVLDRVGMTTVGQLMATIERAALVVANDSASLHIAVGFGRPLIALLGPTDPRLACPYGREGDVLQHVEPGDEFYFRDDRSEGMIRRIAVGEVVARAEANLSGEWARRGP